MGHKLLLLSIVSVLVVSSYGATQQSDIAELLQLRASIENWDSFAAGNSIAGWNRSTPLCLWTGVECNEQGQVLILSLQCDQCTVKARGKLSPGLGNVETLSSLDLQGNAFYGPLPLEWGMQGQFLALQNMYLNDNILTGSIPWDGGGLAQLQLLRVDGNLMEGPLPTNLTLPSLLVLRAFDNAITGRLDSQLLVGMPKLQILALQQNKLAGALPTQGLSTLNELFLQNNGFTGGLPPGWGQPSAFPRLKFLALFNNSLGGQLPGEWGQPGSFPLLNNLQLSNASLNGSLPPSWAEQGAFQQLAAVQLQENDLSGSVDVWAGMGSLQRLTVQPGNPGLCSADQQSLPFRVCNALDNSCMEDVPQLTSPECFHSPANETAGNGTAAAAPKGEGDSGFPVAAVAVPVGVVAVLGVVAGVGAVLWRRRRRRQQQADAAQKRLQEDLAAAQGHPFDTLEGQRTLTSPFAPEFGSVNAAAVARSAEDNVSDETSSSRSKSLQDFQSEQAAVQHVKPTVAGALAAASPAVAARAGAAGVGPIGLTPIASGGNGTAGTLQSTFDAGQSLASQALSSFPMDVPFSDWEINPEELEIAKRPDGSDWELGRGGFGSVYKAWRNKVQPVAVKMLTPGSDVRQITVSDFYKEIALLKACRDANIVQFQGAYMGADKTLLVTEYLEGGNLFANIAAGRVSWWHRGQRVMIDVAKGLVFLHSKRIVHFDLKSPNILLARDGTAKIGDVGMAKFLARDYVTGVMGTLAWAAPEMLWGERCSAKADVYSFGIVLWELCSGERPVRGQLRDVKVPEECPAEVRQLMLECLETRPSRRPTALQIVERLKQAPAQPPPGVEVRPPRRASREEEGQKPASGAEAAAAAASSSPAVQPLHQPEEPPSPPQEEEPGDEPGAAEAEVDP